MCFVYDVWLYLNAPPVTLESQQKSADVRWTVDVLRKLKMYISKPRRPSLWICSNSIFTSLILAAAGTMFAHSFRNPSFPFLSFMFFSALPLKVEVNYDVSAAQHRGSQSLPSWAQTDVTAPLACPGRTTRKSALLRMLAPKQHCLQRECWVWGASLWASLSLGLEFSVLNEWLP